MSKPPDPREPPVDAAILRRALVELRSLRAKVAALEARPREDVAIVGLGCRLPGGADSPARFWSQLCAGEDAVSEIPKARWDVDARYDPRPGTPGRVYTRRAGLLDTAQLTGFDVGLFAISPREAASMDPQHRLLLEVAWEALEDGGISPRALAESRTGVFVGISQSDYAQRQLAAPGQLGGYLASGTALNAAAGRLAHNFGLRGPCMAIDTACSSSLVAVHLACQSLRAGECSTALVGGVNVLLSPLGFVALCAMKMLAADGRCKTFDRDADGYVRGEGCGVLVLRRLADAQAQGDRIWAVIRGSAINQDGASSGLTVPSGPAQALLLREALADAGLEARDVGMIETHGTGTALGDPIEVGALAQVMAADRDPRRPLLLGAVKSAIGHLESAAGIAGLIKAVLCLRHGSVPPNLHLRTINPHLAEHLRTEAGAEGPPMLAPTTLHPWPADAGPRCAGVSAFGFTGTNAHVIVAQAPASTGAPATATGDRPTHVLSLSAHEPAALQALTQRVIDTLSDPSPEPFADLCHTSLVGRAALSHRLCVVADTAAEARAALVDTLGEGRDPSPKAVVRGRFDGGEPPRIGFLYPGQGSQAPGMGRALYEASPVFAASIDRCAAILDPRLERPLRDLLFGPDRTDLDRTANTQPALVALGIALTQLWRSWGIDGAVVLGHSVGEFAAAWAAGILDLEDALTLVAARGRLIQALPAGGIMVAVAAEVAAVEAALAEGRGPDPERTTSPVAIAAINGPSEVVLSGTRAAVEALCARLAPALRREPRALATSHAFHSPLIDPALDAFASEVARVELRTPTRAFISNVSGEIERERPRDPGYWREHMRAPVRFAQGLATMLAHGVDHLIELGPHTTLLGLCAAIAPARGRESWLPSLRRDQPDWSTISRSLATLHAHGAAVDWRAFDAPWPRRRVGFPGYPFQRRRCWIEPAPEPEPEPAPAPEPGVTVEPPFHGVPLQLPGDDRHHRLTLSLETHAYLGDHRIYGEVVVPGAFHLSALLSAVAAELATPRCELRDVTFLQVLQLAAPTALHLVLGAEQNGQRRFRVASPAAGQADASWRNHALGIFGPLADAAPILPAVDLASVRRRCPEQLEGAQIYAQLDDDGIGLGRAFRWIHALWRGDGESLGRLIAPEGLEDLGRAQAPIHPGAFDACLQVLAGAAGPRHEGTAFVPFAIERLRCHRPLREVAWSHVRRRAVADERDRESATFDLRLLDLDGALVAELVGVQVKRAPARALLSTASPAREDASARWLSALRWHPAEGDPGSGSARLGLGDRWLLLTPEGDDPLGAELAAVLEQAGAAPIRARGRRGAALERTDADAGEQTWTLDVTDPALVDALITALDDDADPLRGVLCLASAARPTTAGPPIGCAAALHLAQALARAGRAPASPRLWLVTAGAQAVASITEDVDPQQAALWGLGRTLAGEHPELFAALIDLDPALRASHGEQLADELLADPAPPPHAAQIAHRGAQRYLARLGPVRDRPRAPVDADTEGPWRLSARRRGELGNIERLPLRRRPPGPGEVEIEVEAAGLNFRDVLNMLGRYPDPSEDLGGDCVGRITAIGPDISSARLGQRVFALAPGALRSHVITRAATVAAVPPGLDPIAAASLPAPLLTAYYGLFDLGRLRPGQRVLIHAAAGGVGQAAVQLARRAGAEVFATAKRSKWAQVRALGVEHVMDSRSPSFADEVIARAGAQGIDVVLNSLTGPFITRSFECLAPGGRFIELGKAEIWSRAQVDALRPDVDYQAFDLLDVDPERIAAMLAAIVEGLVAGELRPLPFQTFAVSEAEAAFRTMAAGRHLGRVILRPDRPSGPSPRAPTIRGTWLITGGLGGLGLAFASWLAARGVAELVLIGRRGAQDPATQAAVAELVATGVAVRVEALDVGDREALAALIADLGPTLRGVIHGAGVLEDGALLAYPWSRFTAVWTAKAQAAWHLHELTADLELDAFVLCSSASGWLGAPGQVGYAAANTFLDGLAQRRRAAGLPALSIAWGPWGEVGMAARLGARERSTLRARGVELISTTQGLALLEQALRLDDAAVGAFRIDRQRLRDAGGRLHGLLATLVRDGSASAFTSASASASASTSSSTSASRCAQLLARLQQTPSSRRSEVLAEVLADLAARVLGLAASELSPARALRDFGLDSLMAVELRNAIVDLLDLELPATLIFDHPSLDALARVLLPRLLPRLDPGPAQASGPAVIAPAESDAASDPDAIAIVGIGCRLPGGVRDPDQLWALLREGVDAITEIPRDRWDVDAFYDPDPDAAGKMYTRAGGFVAGIDRFDERLFAIPPREALALDPQHRMVLEVSWEALEHAGLAPTALGESRTGVFIGLSTQDYGRYVNVTAVEGLDAYTGVGASHAMAAGRLAYILGLRGPSMVIDTLCSSSLVTVHLACQSILAGECDAALAGGANAILAPEPTISFCRMHALAPDGRCKAFDARANGYVRSEGCGVVVLTSLSRARREGLRVLAVIRGTAVNHDGHSNGLTAPSGPAQAAVLRAALERAGVEPGSVDYVEAHGTGTALGDPIELQALAEVYGPARPPERPLRVASLKSNIGHLEAAAGIAALIKTTLMLDRGAMPASLHVETPTPHVAWDRLPIRVVDRFSPWPHADGRPRRAGVSAFGMSGTNAHVILEQAPPLEQAPVDAGAPRPQLLPLSAPEAGQLDAVLARWGDALGEATAAPWPDLCHTAAIGRAHFSHRVAIVADTAADARAALERARTRDAAISRGVAPERPPKLALCFAGQGSQHPGMGRELYADAPVFRATLERCAACLDGALERPLLELLFDSPAPLLEQTRHAQPAIVAFELALFELWRAWGVEPDAVIGHSVGELSAAYAAGVLGFEDTLALAAARGRLLQALPGDGAMVAVTASLELVEASLAAAPATARAQVAIAAINGPERVVLSGLRPGLEVVLARLREAGVELRPLPVSHGFHSPQVDGALADFAAILQGVALSPARIPMALAALGRIDGAAAAQPDYWVRQLREPVRYAQGLDALIDAELRTFVEIGPRSTLTGFGLGHPRGAALRWLPSLRHGRSERQALLTALGELYVAGVEIDWRRVDEGEPRRRVTAPRYPFRARRHWPTPAPTPADPPASVVGVDAPGMDPRHRLEWSAAEALEPSPQTGGWILIADQGEVAEALALALRQAGARVCTISARSLAGVLASAGAAGVAGALEGAAASLEGASLCGVVDLGALDLRLEDALTVEVAAEASALAQCARVLAVGQALPQLAARAGATPRLWLITRGAATSDADDPAAASLWGLGRSFATEQPERFGGLIDLERAPTLELETLGRRLAAELGDTAGVKEVALRSGGRLSPRLRRLEAPTERERLELRPDASYLITGGLGGLGLAVARRLVARGAGRLILVGRRGLDRDRDQVRAAVEALGARVTVVAADVARRADVDALISTLRRDGPPLRGIIHAAGVLDDRAWSRQDADALARVLAPKLGGALHLDAATADLDLDFFVLFSSIAAIVGGAGQANYAAANAALDALASASVARGRPMLSVAWGPWSEVGMAARLGSVHERILETRGLGALSPDVGLDLLEDLLARRATGAWAALSLDHARWVQTHADRRRAAILGLAHPEADADTGVDTGADTGAGPAGGALRLKLAATPERARVAVLEAWLRARAAAILGEAEVEALARGRGFVELGMDSMMIVELQRAATIALGVQVSSATLFNHPSVEALAAELVDRLAFADDSSDRGHVDRDDADHGDADHGDADHGDADHGDADHGDPDHGDAALIAAIADRYAKRRGGSP